MKLPFNILLSPILKPYLGKSRLFCQQPIFAISIPYTYFYGTLGFLISVSHLKKHLGERHSGSETSIGSSYDLGNDSLLVHDLKIIATSMGLIQYACLVVGCYTENPALFLPHLTGQLIVVSVKILNVLLLLGHINMKSVIRLRNKVPAIMLMTFNWFQEFCVFRQYLCICDL